MALEYICLTVWAERLLGTVADPGDTYLSEPRGRVREEGYAGKRSSKLAGTHFFLKALFLRSSLFFSVSQVATVLCGGRDSHAEEYCVLY